MKPNKNYIRARMVLKRLSPALIAEKLGMSRQSFDNKVEGRTEFKASEWLALCQMLEIEPSGEATRG